MKKTEGDKNKWKDILCSWTGDIIIVKVLSTGSKKSFLRIQSHFV